MDESVNVDDQNIINESQEICVGENPDWFSRLTAAFPAFTSRNYQFYFVGQLISLIGTWLQIVAEGWLVLQLTNSAFWVGFITAMSTLPSLFFALFGGLIVDRFPKKNIFYLTQTVSLIIAFILGILTVLKLINVWEIALMAFLLGLVNALDMPARQAYVVDLVDKKSLSSAIALNSGIFNAARVIGPSVAGILIGVVGTGGAYLINSLSFLAVIIALFFINTKDHIKKQESHPIQALKEGIFYSVSHPTIRTLLIFTGIISIFGWSYTTLMPVIAKNTFHLGATGLGYLYASGGLGALAATVLVSTSSQKIRPGTLIIGGNTLFAISLLLFSFTTQPLFAMILLFLIGFGLLCTFPTVNSTIQHMVSDHLRGRVMSIYTLMFLGLTPVGNFEVGFIAEKFGTETALRIGAVIVLIFGMLLYFRRSYIREAQQKYEQRIVR